jgi:hypothetical protein
MTTVQITWVICFGFLAIAAWMVYEAIKCKTTYPDEKPVFNQQVNPLNIKLTNPPDDYYNLSSENSKYIILPNHAKVRTTVMSENEKRVVMPEIEIVVDLAFQNAKLDEAYDLIKPKIITIDIRKVINWAYLSVESIVFDFKKDLCEIIYCSMIPSSEMAGGGDYSVR